MEGPETVPTAAHADDRLQQHNCGYSHSTDTEGPESVATAAYPDDRLKQHDYMYTHSTDTEGPESVPTAAHADEAISSITAGICIPWTWRVLFS
jgi:hypothetical protein